ncbi:type II toxin-antitoxin system HigB family toxin [Collimonas sp.]|jgi:mRNA interferase HigB|uniref:type II toxin-antitoxin system HigB family toxin n=1 Tax=Collimonas sp. TaxID=1963772 RepID=UPI0039C8831F
MHIISRKSIEVFCLKHPSARPSLLAWYRLVSTSGFANFTEIRQAFNAADYVCPFTIFDIGGNNFRVISAIHYNRQKLYIREVLTHAEYDRWNKNFRRKRL